MYGHPFLLIAYKRNDSIFAYYEKLIPISLFFSAE